MEFGDWEVPRELVDLAEELGSGAFGLVYKGLYKHPEQGNITCAVKTVRDADKRKDLLDEAAMMK
jgi:predicted Ser/Thr protein kinase